MPRVTGPVSVALFAALTAVVGLQVLNRLVLHLPLIWSEEVARFLFFWVVMLGAAESVRRRRHFVLDVTLGRLEPRGRVGRVIMRMIPDLSVLGFAVFLVVVGIDYMLAGRYRTAANSQVNMALVYAAIPVFALLSVVYAAINVKAAARDAARGRTSDKSPPVAE